MGGIVVGVALPASASTVSFGSTVSSGPLQTVESTPTVVISGGGLSAAVSAVVEAAWQAPVTVTAVADDSLLRQGRSLDPTVAAAPGAGTLTVSWQFSADMGVLGTFTDTSTKTVSCPLNLSGTAYTCGADSDSFRALGTGNIIAEPIIDVGLHTDFTITPTGLITSRSATAGGVPVGAATDLTLTESPTTDTFAVPCSAGVGDVLTYDFVGLSVHPAISATTSVAVHFGTVVPAIGIPPWQVVYLDTENAPIDTSSVDLTLTGTGGSVDLGTVLANNIHPTVSTSAATYSGDEGSPIAFSASATGPCPIGSYVWQFSDGSTAYGPSPHKAFNDNGSYTGQVTGTDTTGLTDTTSFTVEVANLAPVLVVTPPSSIAWGRPLTLQSQATDPGSADQSTLTYVWTFGDTSPSQSGAQTITHTWALPGDYTVTETVTDKDGGHTTATFTVHVLVRQTGLAWTGAISGTYSVPATLSASLVDQFGEAVQGRTISFSVNGAAVGSAQTDASGSASRTSIVALPAGSYGYGASFTPAASDLLYAASSTSATGFAVSRQGSTITYTGAVGGGPNKTVTLSATLVDAAGQPLGGRIVDFTLGTQSTSAVTNSNGIAVTSLKLAQKNGTYPVSATWTPDTTDSSYYTGNSNSTVFKLQVK